MVPRKVVGFWLASGSGAGGASAVARLWEGVEVKVRKMVGVVVESTRGERRSIRLERGAERSRKDMVVSDIRWGGRLL